MRRADPARRRCTFRTWLFRQFAGALVYPSAGRLNADLPDLRLHLSAGEGDLDPRRPGLDALLVFAEPPWPADMQVYELASERIGPVMSPRFADFEQLRQAPASALAEQALLHTTSRPQAWPSWARQHGIEPGALRLGQGLSICIICWKRRLPGWAWQLRQNRWWQKTCERVVWWRRGGSVKPRRTWRCGYPSAPRMGAPGSWRNGSRLSCCANRFNRSISHRVCTAGKPPAGPVRPRRRQRSSMDALERSHGWQRWFHGF